MGTPAGLAFSDTSGILTDRYLVTNPGEYGWSFVCKSRNRGLIKSCLNFFFFFLNIILIIIVFYFDRNRGMIEHSISLVFFSLSFSANSESSQK